MTIAMCKTRGMQGLRGGQIGADENLVVERLQEVTRDLLALALDSLRSPDGLALTHMRLLFAVHDDGESSCVDLATHLGISASSVTRQADRLVASGHLARGTDPTNRSVVILALTARGRAALGKVLDRRARVFDALVSGLDAEGRDAMLVALDAIHAHLQPAPPARAQRLRRG